MSLTKLSLLRALTTVSVILALLGGTTFNGVLIVGGLTGALLFGIPAMILGFRARLQSGQPWMVPRFRSLRANLLLAVSVAVVGVLLAWLKTAMGW